eukprot:TRINITY_DN375_c2_g2_i1.p1 TRINITY_DN375_c2_g2~~TRINITY_DN375_c2_g2_i1.p1  ORF type:complete len:146 (-),score=28.86 TRINITY_DN375_c2_g2_i1:223-660(-)
MATKAPRVYLDGIFDLCHFGHVNAMKISKERAGEDGTLICGIVGDAVATPYKRTPIVSEKHRAGIVEAIRYVDEIVVPAPLEMTPEYVRRHKIDIIVHGFANEKDKANFFRRHSQVVGMEGLLIEEIPYTPGISTSAIIKRLSKL